MPEQFWSRATFTYQPDGNLKLNL